MLWCCYTHYFYSLCRCFYRFFHIDDLLSMNTVSHSFQSIYSPLLPFLLFLQMTLARTSYTMLNRNGESWYLCLILILGKSNLFTSKYNVSTEVFVDTLYKTEEVPFYSSLLRTLIMNRSWILLNVFSASIEMNFFFFF